MGQIALGWAIKMTKLLDCTLRDGGYYNHWDFAPELVDRYLLAMEASGVDIVELGFRTPPKSAIDDQGDKAEFLGPFAFTTDDYLAKLDLSPKIQWAVMVNTRDYLLHPSTPVIAIKKYFSPKKNSPVSLVRMATHFSDVVAAKEVALTLKELGYQVGLNLMQMGVQSLETIEKTIQTIATWKIIDVLYFADSLGNMTSADVVRYVEILKRYFDGPIGIHAHNNMGLAQSNSQTALDNSVEYIDSTVLGMGRGAGNAKTEYLLMDLAAQNKKYNVEPLLPIVLGDFQVLKSEFQWGESLPYYLAAKHSIHPTFIQNLLQNKSFKIHHVISAIQSLSGEESLKYSNQQLMSSISPQYKGIEGTWNPSDEHHAEILLIASGAKLKNYQRDVHYFIKKNKPYVISLNINSEINPEFIDTYAVCNPIQFFMESNRYKSLSKPIIMPLEAAPQSVLKQLDKLDIKNYGMKIEEDKLNVEAKRCTLPYPMVMAYVLCLSKAMKAHKIYLAGFDGYPEGDARRARVEKILNLFSQLAPSIEIVAITPSVYKISNTSVYAPL